MINLERCGKKWTLTISRYYPSSAWNNCEKPWKISVNISNLWTSI